MKNNKYKDVRFLIGLTLLTACLFVSALARPAGAAPVSIKNGKHDLSALSTGGTYTAKPAALGGTEEICVFCHTPHSSKPDAPLWNRSTVLTSYQVYTSDVLGALAYPSAESPSSVVSGDPHVKTRICLSCHDGTIALGSVVNLPPNVEGAFSRIQMSGAEQIQPASSGYLGVDLRDDHPVAIPHIAGGADPELIAPGGASKIRLYAGGSNNYIECTSCHDAHDNQYGNFLVETNKQSALCRECHDKAGFTVGAHNDNTIPVTYQPTDGAGSTLADPGTRVGDVKCMSCHFPHKAGVSDASKTSPVPAQGRYLLSFNEEQSCFNTNNDRWNTANSNQACHGTGTLLTSGNVAAEVSRNIAHRTGDRTGVHRASEVRSGTGAGWFSGKEHVECDDCHNSHRAGRGLHTAGTNTIGPSSALFGAAYVRPDFTGVSEWTTPSGLIYTPVEPLGVTTSATWASDVKEYEICFKCHSSFATNGGVFPSSRTDLQPMTDQSKEFNRNNTSYHPVTQKNTNAGQYDPPAGSFTGGWNSGSLMYCSDCHTSDVAGSRPQGPHGSTKAYLLKYDNLNTYSTVTNGAQDEQNLASLCLQCHAPSVYNTYSTGDATTGTGFMTSPAGVNLHNRHKTLSRNSPLSGFAYRCVNCHIRIPHGYKTYRGLIVSNDADATRYAAGGAAKVLSFTQPAAQSYGALKTANCTNTAAGCH